MSDDTNPTHDPTHEACEETNWRDEYKDLEQAYHLLLDQYAEVARALGIPCSDAFETPLWSHEAIVEYARRCVG